jgi:hypothetical protein
MARTDMVDLAPGMATYDAGATWARAPGMDMYEPAKGKPPADSALRGPAEPGVSCLPRVSAVSGARMPWGESAARGFSSSASARFFWPSRE